ncbi:methyl-accepting chemotaxis protein [Treponema phagedenis]|uniref:Methyl-accepting chemotaxis protein signaling domain protein n=1 Tax=Treponema phagedenis TaxID=162 RepID=A0A0B7GVS5_TREPH|nr:methyl-accepting chemotaxis protein [Treponema phagedenis]QEJ95848.1 methyl-accepting chemotaxis protein [Treponema phagedenis]QSH98526.1 methyl-accepting chemotaxis protein [Treponema phagedenis]CEM61045.1 Methyl-accepting chemotaxis protein signaling domain protein [Treponema phagedenis]
MLTAVITVLISGAMDASIVNTALASKFFVATIVIPPAIVIIKYKKLNKHLQNWKEDLLSAQKAIVSYQRTVPVTPIAVSLVSPLLISLETGIIKDSNLFMTSYVLSVGNVFAVASFFATLTIRHLEKSTNFIPLNKDLLGMSLTSKIFMISFFSSVSIAFLTLLPFLNKNFEPEFINLVTRLLPLHIFGIGFAVVNIVSVMRGNINRLMLIYDNIENLSHGNYKLDDIVITSRDEIGFLMTNFNSFLSFNKQFLKDIDVAINKSNVVADELAANMNETSATLQQISGNVSSVNESTQMQTSGVLETQATIEQIARTIESLDRNIEHQASTVAESSSAIEEMVANIHSVADVLEKNAISIANLDKQTQTATNSTQEAATHIEKVVEASEGLLEASNVIQHIASQTNLLAMNAAIEAAHAGEAGKGFAVVADEIRKLAEEAGTQGKQISVVLKTLQQDIETVANGAKTVVTQITEISNLSYAIRDQETVIMNAMEEQTSGSTQVLEAIRDITKITEEVRLGSGEMLTGNTEVGKEMTRLANGAQQVQNSMHEISGGTNQIASAVEQIITMSEENKKAIITVMGHLAKLKF